MAIDFPNSPAVNDIFTVGNIRWIWTGTTWKLKESGVIGLQGTTGLGIQGIQGNLGISGIVAQATPPVDTSVVWADTSTSASPSGNLAFNTQIASYTLVLSDAGINIVMNSGSANSLTVPPNSSVPFAIGTQILIAQLGAGQTTVIAGSGVTIYSNGNKLKLSGQYAEAALIKYSTDTWFLSGNLSA